MLDRPKYGMAHFNVFCHLDLFANAEYLLSQMIRGKALFGTITEETRNNIV